jgi:hypothetical protein
MDLGYPAHLRLLRLQLKPHPLAAAKTKLFGLSGVRHFKSKQLFTMKTIAFLLLLAAPVLAYATEIHPGDSFTDVQAALGAPQGQIQLANKLVLVYDRGQVQLVDGKVTDSNLISAEDFGIEQAELKARATHPDMSVQFYAQLSAQTQAAYEAQRAAKMQAAQKQAAAQQAADDQAAMQQAAQPQIAEQPQPQQACNDQPQQQYDNQPQQCQSAQPPQSVAEQQPDVQPQSPPDSGSDSSSPTNTRPVLLPFQIMHF